MKYWLVKQEPEKYSFDDLIRDKKTVWDGVRNYQARNNLREMKTGDRVLFYHSVSDKAVVGVAEVSREAYQDPTDDTGKWSVVEISALEKFADPVTLQEIKDDQKLGEIALIRQSRLSVVPLKKAEFDRIAKKGK
ncbi:MAG: EVE domain-containing protein [Pyrinomonadaceae bacterium]